MQKLSYKWETLKSSTNRKFTIIFNTDDTRGTTSLYLSFSSASAFLCPRGWFSTNSCQLFFFFSPLYDFLNWLEAFYLNFCTCSNVFYSTPIVIVWKYISFSKVTLSHCCVISTTSNNFAPNFLFYQKLVHLVCKETVSVLEVKWDGLQNKGEQIKIKITYGDKWFCFCAQFLIKLIL